MAPFPLLQTDCFGALVLMTLPLFTIPWRQQSDLSTGNASVEYNEKGFKVNLDVRQFKPEEIKVKVGEGFIIVEGNHEEHQDDGEILSRQFVRRYRIPHDVDQRTITSKLSGDGILEIEALRKITSSSYVGNPTHNGQQNLKQDQERSVKLDQ